MIANAAEYLIAIILYLCAYIYALQFAVSIQNCETDTCKDIKAVHESCLFGCPDGTSSLLTKFRGGNYYIGASKETNSKQGDCLATFWSGTHFMLYLLLGIFCPNLFWQTFAFGAAFEVYEYYEYDCADPLDILFNTTGFLIGRAGRSMFI